MEHSPAPSKYNVFAMPNVMPYCLDVEDAVARISAITEAMILLAAVCDVALRFVCTPTGISPKMAIKQKAAIPRARVTSTREKAHLLCFFIADKLLRCRRSR